MLPMDYCLIQFHLQIVDRHSAVIDIPHEEVFGLYANHRTMCRFADAADSEYGTVSRHIERLATKALSTRKPETTAAETSTSQCM